MRRKPTTTLALGLVVLGSAGTAHALPERLAQPISTTSPGPRTLGSAAATSGGSSIVSVRLPSRAPAADLATIEAEQQAFLSRHQGPGIRVIARTRLVLNAVFLEVEDEMMAEITADPMVQKVTPVGNYELDLSETVPYIGAAAVQAAGIDGSGVRVAVLDSGIDYLHADLGGSGDPDEYAANNRDVVESGSFPTAKVVGGYDFVGELWPTLGPLQPDPDPLDFEGHGTHVADIIAGNLGVAPGASLYAVKVCSAISSACSGIALIQGVEFSVDPNGDGDTSDHVDIMNMSLGANYGQPFDDDLAFAVDNATNFGVLTVASAGNGSDRPYVTGTPAAASTALSVAQTAVPSATQDFMEVTAPAADAGLYLAVRQPWSGALTTAISGPVQYADGAGGNLNGCAPFAPNSLTGQIVVVDRGGCFFSDKIRNIEDAGGALGIIALVAPGDPFPGGFGGGGPISIPGFMITQAAGDILRTGSAVVSFDPANGVNLAGSMVSSSSRGPRNFDNVIKPDIGAPGASISAQAGTGTLRTPFGGTSGAAPMVAGAAALLLEARPWLSPQLARTSLMNGADPMVAKDFTGTPAEVSRIGAGEVNVVPSFEATLEVMTGDDYEPKISMGYVPVARNRQVIRRVLKITNMTRQGRRFDVASSFRFADDAASGAMEIRHPSRVFVPPQTTKRINVRFVINGASLPSSSLSSGVAGADPATLTATEFDGYITVSDAYDTVNVPWHVIPRKSARVVGRKRLKMRGGSDAITLRNRGVETAQNDAFTLLAISGPLPPGKEGAQSPTPDLKGVGVRTIPVPAGFCSADASFLLEFAFTTWAPQTNVLPVIFSALIDVDNDGTPDYEAFNGDLNFVLFGDGTLGGQSVSIASDLAAESAGAFFFATHATNTKNTVITYCAEQLGLTAADLGTRDITVTFSTFDFYFGGPRDDTVLPVTFTLGGGYQASLPDIPAGDSGVMTVTDAGGTSPNLGIMLFTNGDRGAGSRGGATPDTEVLFFTPRGVKAPSSYD